MRNWRSCSGVYSGMVRVPLLLLYSLTALAQPGPRQDPMDAAIDAVWRARSMSRFSEAAAGLEQARAQLQRTPVNSPRFAGWARQVAQLYQSSGWNAQARAIVQEALERTGPLGDAHPSRTDLLNAMGDLWLQDGNLLKAVGYLEQAATAQAVAPPAAAPAFTEQAGRIAVMGTFAVRIFAGSGFPNGGGMPGSSIYAYIRLADLYQRLGRPDAVAAVAAKIRALGSNDKGALARFYEQQGQFEEAAASLQKDGGTIDGCAGKGKRLAIAGERLCGTGALHRRGGGDEAGDRSGGRRPTSRGFAARRCGCARIWPATCGGRT